MTGSRVLSGISAKKKTTRTLSCEQVSKKWNVMPQCGVGKLYAAPLPQNPERGAALYEP